MKTIILFGLLLSLVSCQQDQSSSPDKPVPTILSPLLLDHNWRNTVSCVGAGCSFKALVFAPTALAMFDFTKAIAAQDGISTMESEETFDFEATGTLSGIATSRTDRTKQYVIVADQYDGARIRICIDATCGLFEKLEAGDL